MRHRGKSDFSDIACVDMGDTTLTYARVDDLTLLDEINLPEEII